MNWVGTLNRLGRVTSVAVVRMTPLAMLWRMLSRLVSSIWKRSTWGVNGTPGGKCPLIPIGDTKRTLLLSSLLALAPPVLPLPVLDGALLVSLPESWLV